jgi:hypothetical protein
VNSIGRALVAIACVAGIVLIAVFAPNTSNVVFLYAGLAIIGFVAVADWGD